MYNKGPFADWVPKPVMLLLIIIFMFPFMLVNAVYSTDLAGTFATYNEFITFANNAGTIGMGTAILILMRIKMRFTSKQIITTSAVIIAALLYWCSVNPNPYVVIISSFFIGFFKMFGIIEMVLPVMFIISPNNDRGRFYSVFYPLTLVASQLSSYYFSQMIFEHNWQAPYLAMSVVMLIIALLSQIFQHNLPFGFKVPLYQIDMVTLFLFVASMMLLNFGFVFMRQQAWFSSPYILMSLIMGLVLFIAVFYRQKMLKRKLIDVSAFQKSNVLHSIVLLMFLGVYLAATGVFTAYTTGVLGYNSQIVAGINIWMIPGIVLSGIYAFFSFKNNWKLKYYIASGFIGFFIHTAILYFILQPQMNIEYLQYSMIFKGFGMCTLFIAIWYYSSVGLSMEQLMGSIGILIVIRSFVATAVGGAIIGWALYEGQWQSMNNLSIYLDSTQIPNGMAVFQNISINAVLSASKKVLGALCLFTVPVLFFIFTHHYGQFNYRRVIILRKMIRGNSVKGYRLS